MRVEVRWIGVFHWTSCFGELAFSFFLDKTWQLSGWRLGCDLWTGDGTKQVLTYFNSIICYTTYCYFSYSCITAFLFLCWQAWQCMPDRAFSWNVLSLFTKSGMLFLEVSLIAFLLQGNETSGFESLARTFVISGAVVAADVLLKVCHCSIVQAE